MEKLSVILCTIPSDGKGDCIAENLVKEKLVACVNIIPGIKSVYEWNGEICNDEEKLLIIKTLETHVDKVFNYIKNHHPYDTPERINISVSKVGEDYLNWANNYIK